MSDASIENEVIRRWQEGMSHAKDRRGVADLAPPGGADR